MPERCIPAEHFLTTLAANVENTRLTDKELRTFIRNTLPIVIFPRPEELQEKR